MAPRAHQRIMQAQFQTYELEPVVRWRHDQLVAEGFSELIALHLAYDQRWDLHDLLELRTRGCPPELAVRILAPIDVEDAERP
jgi:hypothetical protein